MAKERDDRRFPARPLVGVGAVIWDGERILLARRARAPAQGKWSLPGGLIEIGETAEAAVRREVQEECGIQVDVGPLLGLFEPILWDIDGRARYHFVVIDFLAYPRGGEVRSGDDAAETRWVAPGDLGLYDLSEELLVMIRRALALQAGGEREGHSM